MSTPSTGGDLVTMGESLLALVFIVAILVALGESPLYPLAFGAVGIAALYLLLEHPTAISGRVKWAASKLQ